MYPVSANTTRRNLDTHILQMLLIELGDYHIEDMKLLQTVENFEIIYTSIKFNVFPRPIIICNSKRQVFQDFHADHFTKKSMALIIPNLKMYYNFVQINMYNKIFKGTI